MEKTARKIFQPNALTNKLLDGVCRVGGENISDFINLTIEDFFTPQNELLKKEMDWIFKRIKNNEPVDADELKASLARCVKTLKDYPIDDVRPLEQILIHFTTSRGREYRYDYIQIVDSQQDETLHHLNDVLKTLDRDFTLGMRELGERTRTVFAFWETLWQYSEIYVALATIIECENIYYELDVFRTIDLIRWLDKCIQASPLGAIKTPYPTDISLSERYYGISYEVNVYQTDNGYAALSGDAAFSHMSPEIISYYKHIAEHHSPFGEPTEGDLARIKEIEQEGRMLFRRLVYRQHKE